MLTIEQLKFIRNQLSFPKSNAVIPAKCAADHANELLIGEIRRLTSGPFTLAEAIASGKSFAEIDAPEPTPWIVREGRTLYIAKPNGEPSGSTYWPSVREMCEPVFKLKPEAAP